jgi:DNA-binding CsgD family transcriptional regulator
MLPSDAAALPPGELVNLALRLTTNGAADLLPSSTTSALDEALNGYCAARSLSRRQRQVLELYLSGKNDKEIAGSFNCSATTVYEYWRRMAKKANGVHKSDVVNDFHRFLADRSDGVRPSLLAAAPRRSSRPPAP